MSSVFPSAKNLRVAETTVLSSSQFPLSVRIEPVSSSTMISVLTLPSALNSNVESVRHPPNASADPTSAVAKRATALRAERFAFDLSPPERRRMRVALPGPRQHPPADP